MKVYVVTATYSDRTEMLYAGMDEGRAFQLNFDNLGKILSMELKVWKEGVHLETHKRISIYEWSRVYDKLETLDKKVKELEELLVKAKEEFKYTSKLIESVE